MEKELSINLKPYVTSFSYYSFPLCILMAEERIGEKIAVFSVLESKRNDFTLEGMIKKIDNKWVAKNNDKYLERCNSCIYRKMEEYDYLEIEIEYQQYTNSWAAVNLFVTDSLEEIADSDKEYLFRFGNFLHNGINLYKKGNQVIEPFDLIEEKKLLLVRDGSRFKFYCVDGKKRYLLAEQVFNQYKDIQLYVGVQVKHGDNSFYKWLFQNYVQLSCDINNRDRKLEFYYGLSKNWEYNNFSYFFDIKEYIYDDYSKLGNIRYLKRCIDRGEYIHLMIDQMYLPGREEYHSYSHYHQNLIYGYSDSDKVFMLVGFTNSGKIKKFVISYTELKDSIRANCSCFQVIKYCQDVVFYELRTEYIYEVLCEYLHGIDSSLHTQFLHSSDARVYGMKIYDELMKEKGIEAFICDRRVSNVLWEHKILMLERIYYLQHKGVIPEKDGERYIDVYKNIVDIAYDLKNLALKYRLCPQKTNEQMIINKLQIMVSKEKECLQELLNEWKQ